jgi:hypothetical protein
MGSSPARELMNQQIDDIVADISAIIMMFRNPNLDLSSLQIRNESDFVLGAVWASVTLYFVNAFTRHFRRPPTDAEQLEANYTLLERGREIRETVMRTMGVQCKSLSYN